MPRLRRSVAGLSPRRSGLNPRPVRVGFVLHKVTLGQIFLRVLRFPPVNVIPPMLHDHSFIHSSITDAVPSHRVTASLNSNNNHNHNHLALQPFVGFRLLSQVSPSSSILSCFLPDFNFQLF